MRHWGVVTPRLPIFATGAHMSFSAHLAFLPDICGPFLRRCRPPPAPYQDSVAQRVACGSTHRSVRHWVHGLFPSRKGCVSAAETSMGADAIVPATGTLLHAGVRRRAQHDTAWTPLTVRRYL